MNIAICLSGETDNDTIGRLLKIVLLCMTLHFSSAAGAGSDTLLRLSANHWEPYTGANLPHYGVASEIVSTVLARAGYSSKISIMPWSRALATTYAGGVDGIVAIWLTDRRESRILYSDSYMSNELFLFYTRTELSGKSNLDDLSGLRIGVGRDYDYSDEFLRHKNFKVEPVDQVVQNLMKLSVGRVDMVLEDRRIVSYTVSHYPTDARLFSKIRASSMPLLSLPLYFGINRNYPKAQEIISAFNEQLKAMRRDGTLESIIRRSDANSPVRDLSK
jgi:polar amino acid transport system substrate-binding protein